MFVAGIYFPPGKTIAKGKEMINCLTQCLHALLRKNPSAVILRAGDFKNLELKSLRGNFNLHKHVLAPTCGKNLLDEILTNMSSLYNHGL